MAILGELAESFRKQVQGLQYYSPKILDAIQRITKVRLFSDSSLHHSFESENFRFPFFKTVVGCH